MRIDDVASPSSLQEALAYLRRRPDAVPWAGGTLIAAYPSELGRGGPIAALDLHRIAELRHLFPSDRYLELGSCVSLNQLAALPERRVAAPLRAAALAVGSYAIRNLATLGGNLASKGRPMSTLPALSCVDAVIELRSPAGGRWASIHSLVGHDGRVAIPHAALVTRVRVGLQSWDSVEFRLCGGGPYPHPDAATFCACARASSGTVGELRIAYACRALVRSREAETELVGRRLPLSRRDIEAFGAALARRARELGQAEAAVAECERLAGAYLAKLSEV